ncbi:unnamed protein product [Brassica rapa]|uniref:Uncharacterized protein n=1 Tax=Brassica campestris TaxID=3711 RepID=A0A3P5Y046_BRACM|nr:unnamed protein product [Brassica rapa]VDC60702.1 unnamed protein product [Brassica rapa]
MLVVLWLTKRYPFSFRRKRSQLYMEQWRDSRHDDGEEGRRLGLNGFVRFSFLQICETSFSATARVTWQSSTYRYRRPCFGSN